MEKTSGSLKCAGSKSAAQAFCAMLVRGDWEEKWG